MQSFTIEEFKKIHQEWKESGLSVRDYCANTVLPIPVQGRLPGYALQSTLDRVAKVHLFQGLRKSSAWVVY